MTESSEVEKAAAKILNNPSCAKPLIQRLLDENDAENALRIKRCWMEETGLNEQEILKDCFPAAGISAELEQIKSLFQIKNMENGRLKKQLAKDFPDFKPLIIDEKDMEEMFREAIKFMRDAAEQHRKQDKGEFGSPSVVYDNVCDEFELVVDYCRELKTETERLKKQLTSATNEVEGGEAH